MLSFAECQRAGSGSLRLGGTRAHRHVNRTDNDVDHDHRPGAGARGERRISAGPRAPGDFDLRGATNWAIVTTCADSRHRQPRGFSVR